MKKSLKEFKEDLKKINTEIRKHCYSRGGMLPLVDGPIDTETYYHSPNKIVWLLKEGYDSETGKGGWRYSELAKGNAYEEFFRWKSQATWHPIIYTTQGILKKFDRYNDMPYIKDEPDLCKVVKNIAIINVQKLPAKGESISNWPDINKAFDKNVNILKEQIELLRPDILIGCSTMHLYKGILGISDAKWTRKTITDYCIKDDVLYVDAYHPAHRCSKELYVNEIIEAAENLKIATLI